MISWECKVENEVKDKVKNEIKDEIGNLYFIFNICDLILNFVFQIEIASSRLGFSFFVLIQKTKQKKSRL